MQIFPTKTPAIAKRLYPNYLWHVSTVENNIYLTFDDGPTPEITDWVLQELKKHNAKATFFCIGNNVTNHPEILQNTDEDGHTFGNHTFNHINGWFTSKENYLKEFEACQKALEKKIFKRNESLESHCKLFRPPYGKIRNKQAKEILALGSKIVMWDVLSFDWDKNVSPEKCLHNVIKNTEAGSIIVFHDSKKAWKNLKFVLPRVLKHFSDLGYQFKSL